MNEMGNKQQPAVASGRTRTIVDPIHNDLGMLHSRSPSTCVRNIECFEPGRYNS